MGTTFWVQMFEPKKHRRGLKIGRRLKAESAELAAAAARARSSPSVGAAAFSITHYDVSRLPATFEILIKVGTVPPDFGDILQDEVEQMTGGTDAPNER